MKCVYTITCLVSGNQYVGSTINFQKRKYGHRSDLRKSRHHSYLLQRAHDKHGLTALSWAIVEELPADAGKEELEQAELRWIAKLAPRYNASQSVNRHALGQKRGPLSEERKQKIREAVTGFKHTEDAKEKMRQPRGPLNPSEAHLEVLRENGRKRGAAGQSEATREKIRLLKTGTIHSEETKRKRSVALAGKPWTAARIAAKATGKKAGAPAGKPWSKARRAAQAAKPKSKKSA